MKLCLVTWPIRAYFAVPDGASFFIRGGERDASLVLRRFDGVRLYSYMGSDYRWIPGFPGSETAVNYRITENRDDGESVVVRQVHGNTEGGPFRGGTLDPEYYTLAEVCFELDDEIDVVDQGQIQILIDYVRELLQGFALRYQLATGEVDIALADIGDPGVAEIWLADTYTFNPKVIEGNFQLAPRHISWKAATRRAFLKNTLSEDRLEMLRHMVEAREPVPLFQQLLLEAKAYSKNSGNHDIAIVTIETAFEAFLQERLLAVCQARGILLLPERRGKGAPNVPYEEAIERASGRELLRLINFVIGQNVMDTPLYQRWYESAWERRHAIVHDGFRGNSDEHAGEAFEATTSFIAFLRSLMG